MQGHFGLIEWVGIDIYEKDGTFRMFYWSSSFVALLTPDTCFDSGGGFGSL
jgi:hypothetical protein